ncbi:hypothetical protein [Rufibacter sp. XAAS-G3-1]|uniref:hypothetical protein n=1 Tax=Rufibacter sp. XAAS-G3-1 TaxID=2729134 RepID=UPI0015E79B1C|nr:hypothetical protein [Rufibacter sp. XAAS-G3-1]
METENSPRATCGLGSTKAAIHSIQKRCSAPTSASLSRYHIKIKSLKMVIVTDIKPSRNPEWHIVTVSNLEDELEKTVSEARGYKYEPESCGFPVKATQTSFYVGKTFKGSVVITETSEEAYWEGQKPNRVDGLYYRNVAVDCKENGTKLKILKFTSKILEEKGLDEYYSDSLIVLSVYLPYIKELTYALNLLSLKHCLKSPIYLEDDELKPGRYVSKLTNVCLILGLNADALLKHFLVKVGQELYSKKNFTVYISHATSEDVDEDILVEFNQKFDCKFSLNHFEDAEYFNISEAINPDEILKLPLQKLESKELEKLYPNIKPDDLGKLSRCGDEWDSRNYREEDTSDRDAFDALTDGQYGDWDDFGGDIDDMRTMGGY